nr:MAG TPA: hypothetical protein [Caudoviricetes sp.]
MWITFYIYKFLRSYPQTYPQKNTCNLWITYI